MIDEIYPLFSNLQLLNETQNVSVQVAQHIPTISTSYGDWIMEKRQSTGKNLTPGTGGGTHDVVSAHILTCQDINKTSIF